MQGRAERTSFVGRAREIAAIVSLLRGDARLVTLLGPPGIGKTRLARRVSSAIGKEETATGELRLVGGARSGARVHAVVDRPVFFCELAETGTLREVVMAVATMLGVSLAQDHDDEASVARVGQALSRSRAPLVVLDNCEQVVGPVTTAVHAWLEAVPDLQLLATSRVRLRIAGEHCIEVPALPPADAERLFVDRARQLDSTFTIEGTRDRASLQALLGRLDHAPLAVELAAARVRILSVPAMLDRLAQPLELLRDRRGNGSMRHTLEASHRLLDRWERDAFAQCAVFRGGFTLAVAESVIALGDEAPPALDVIEALRDHSLLSANVQPTGELRFGLYEVVRALAVERLEQSALRLEVERRHAETYARLGETNPQHGAVALASLAQERENLLAAFSWACREERSDLVLRLGLTLLPLIGRVGPAQTHDEISTAALQHARTTGRTADEVDLLIARARFVNNRRADPLRNATTRRALEVAQTLPDRTREAIVLAMSIGDTRNDGDIAAAHAIADRTMSLCGGALDEDARAYGFLQVSMLRCQEGALLEARTLLESAASLARKVGARRTLALTTINLGVFHRMQGDLRRARRYLDDPSLAPDEHGEGFLSASSIAARAAVERDEGSLHEAAALLDRALDLGRRSADARTELEARVEHARVAHDMGDLPRARAFVEEGLSLLPAVGRPVFTAWALQVDALLLQEEGHPGAAARRLDEGIAIARTSDRPQEALMLADRAILHLERGELAEGATMLEGSVQRLSSYGERRQVALAAAHLGLARSALGEDDAARAAFAVARAHLADVTMPEVIETVAWLEARSFGSPVDAPAPQRSSALLRRSMRVVSSLADRARENRATAMAMELARDGRWFRITDTKVELTRRGALRLILVALANHSHAAPGAALTMEQVVAAGWPGERIRIEAAAQRVYTSIRTLRTLGLREHLVTRDDGYLLAPGLRVVWA
jgi:predicted ATPase/tetratricopeptide (TPR) repeat protein